MSHPNTKLFCNDKIVATDNPLPVSAVAPAPAAGNKATLVRGLKAPASVGVAEALAAAGTFVQTVTIFAQRAARVANAGSVFVDSVAGANAQLIELTPGGFVTFTAPPGKVLDLGDILVDSETLTDGVFFLGLL